MRQPPNKNLAARLTALLQATRVMASSLDLEQSLQAIVQQATIISGTSVVRLLLLDADGKLLRCRAGVGLPMEEERELVIPVGESFSGQVVATGKPLVVADTREDPRLRYPQHPTRRGLISYLGLPVKLGDRVLGVLVFNTQSPRTYSKTEIAYLSAFADHAAVVIENARLFQEEGAGRRQLESVRAVSTEIARELDLDAVLGLIVRRATELTDTGTGTVYLWNEKAQALFPRAWHGHGEWIRGLSFRLGEGVVGTAAQRQEGLSVNDYRTSPYAVPLTLEHSRITAVLAEPLLYRDRLLGVIGLDNESTQRPFTQEDRDILTLFAGQAAIAIENARLLREERDRRRQLEAVRVVTEEIARELDLSAVLGLITRGAADLMGTSFGAVYLWDEATEVLTPRAWHGFGDWMSEVRLRPGEAVAGVVAQRREGMIVNDLPTSPYGHSLFVERTGNIAVVAEPLLYRDRLVGVIAIGTDKHKQPFTPQHRETLALFAAQAAIAIENARLYGEALEKTERLEGLTRTSAKVAGTLRLEELLDAIVQEAAKLLRAEGAGLRLLEGDRLVVASRYGLAHHTTLTPSLRIGESLGGLVVQQGRPLMVPDQREDSQILVEHRTAAAAHGAVAYLGVPVRYRDRIIGVLHVDGKERRTFSEEEIRLLSAFADHAAVAIENARLYGEIQQHAATLEARVKERTAELEEALRVKVEFLGKMSHELRTPLNFILGFSDLLQQGTGGALTPKQATYLDRIQGGGRRLLSLVSEVLDIAQLDAGKSRLRLEPVILAPLVQEILGLVQIPVSQKRLKVTPALDPWMPFIVADRFKLAQILHSLVGNAVKFTPEGGSIRIITRQAPGAGNGGPDGGGQPLPSADSVELIVEDTGIGIRPEESGNGLRGLLSSRRVRHPGPGWGGAGPGPGPQARGAARGLGLGRERGPGTGEPFRRPAPAPGGSQGKANPAGGG